MRHIKTVVCLALVAFIAGCGSQEQQAIWTAEKAVKAKLKDPASARFKETYLVVNEERSVGGFTSGTVCGVVEGKNSFGAYADPQRFVATAVMGDGVLDVSNVQMEGHGVDAQAFLNVYWLPCSKER
ncbi:hypothetical protein [Pseudomonas peli]|uniref:hypothetical protein n=1 Tax=Pseudomonas peli TaxID=592361 RepID=UPI002865053C|nr:hypothetical protein [Pseudomonas peli]MDR7024371.1 hypothetical protein [Pseudomonas peli]